MVAATLTFPGTRGNLPFVHCGSGVIRSKARRVEAVVHAPGRERSIAVRLARDGLTMSVSKKNRVAWRL